MCGAFCVRLGRARAFADRWNDLESFSDALRRHGDDIAAVVITPFHHPLFRASELPESGFLQAVEFRRSEANQGGLRAARLLKTGLRSGAGRCVN